MPLDAPDPSTPVRTRFAPSPTGELHVGGARTALFNWAYARRHGGQFVLRVEDTDQKRSSDASMRHILRDLAWLGIDWDEGPTLAGDTIETRGDAGPYFQSQRLDLYRGAVDQLRRLDQAYDDDGAVRFRVSGNDVTVDDLVLGAVTYPAAELEDFVILKADGFPTFHLANVVDDSGMGITHVIRGQEHLINTSKHLALFEALGLTPPAYAHIPLIFNPDGSKMSKRDKAKAARAAGSAQGWPAIGVEGDRYAAFQAGDSHDLDITHAVAEVLRLDLPAIDVSDFRDAGYLPGVVCNYLALLGWNPGGDVEHFDNAFLAERFGFDRVGKGQGKFDRAKLAAFNQDAFLAMDAQQFAAAVRPFATDAFEALLDDAAWPVFAGAYRERSKTLRDPFAQGAFFVAADDSFEFDPNAKATKKAVLEGEPRGRDCLAQFRDTLAGLDPWSGAAAHAAMEAWAADNGQNIGKLAQPIRVAVSGAPVTPPIDATLDILGKDRTMARIDRFLRLSETW